MKQVIFMPLLSKILFAILNVGHVELESGVYTYLSYGDPVLNGGPSSLIVDVPSQKLRVGHSWRSMYVCEPSSELHCFHAQSLNFSIPRAGMQLGDSWVSKKYQFKVVREERVSILGQICHCYVIEELKSGSQFFYSNERGLIGFRIKSDDGFTLFLSRDEHGFPKDKVIP